LKYDVKIDDANEVKEEITAYLNPADGRILNRTSNFASLYDFGAVKYRHPVLVLKTEEPGSKQLIAARHDRIEGVCHDMVNHLINDCISMGATPLAVQDAIICGRLDKGIVKRIVKAVSEACTNNGCLLTGGETSEQPGVLNDGTYILTSSIVGAVEKDEIIDGSGIQEGDIVIGLASNGVHTNGYTLVRKLMEERPEILDADIAGESFIDAILKPHSCYYPAIKDLFGANSPLKGIAHITGGGIKENLNRILPKNLNAVIDLAAYDITPIFKVIRKYGEVSDAEMLRTFNMGVGLTVVVSPVDADKVIKHINGNGIAVKRIGVVVKGNGTVICENEFKW